jgi:hypothetical protein
VGVGEKHVTAVETAAYGQEGVANDEVVISDSGAFQAAVVDFNHRQ